MLRLGKPACGRCGRLDSADVRCSVTIITRDEADNIGDAIASARWADEILVLDCGSTDGTPDLARTAGASVQIEPWRGYGAQKNRATALARNRWVFSLDADERIDARLAMAMQALPDAPPQPLFAVRRRNRIAGRIIRHYPWSWDVQRRLYDRETTGFSEALLHESLQVPPGVRTSVLPGVLDHFTYRDWADFRRRQLRYADLWAQQAQRNGRRIGAIKGLGDPLVAFFRDYCLRGYWLGGWTGLRLAAGAARNNWWRWQALRRLPPQT